MFYLSSLKAIFFSICIFILPLASVAGPIVGASQIDQYLPLLKNKRVGLIVNQTSVINNTHLVDTLHKLGVKIQSIFAPEHGFRGDYAPGETVNNTVDKKTGIPIVSLYGNNKKPSPQMLEGLDWVVFDIQDVGVRFYTFISTMHLAMEACAENNVKFMVLDRPNPNGHFIDGPILQAQFASFVGMHPIPIIHGLTVAELAQMIQGEGWLANKVQCDLTIVKVKNYRHSDTFVLPIAPSPNLPNQLSIMLYAGLCLFEGTAVSVGRGTDAPFQSFGFPAWHSTPYVFTPKPIPGVADNPPLKNMICFGYSMQGLEHVKVFEQAKLNLDWLLMAYDGYTNKKSFFNPFFEKLAGNAVLKQQIIAGWDETQIRKSWEKGLVDYQKTRMKYLLYPLN